MIITVYDEYFKRIDILRKYTFAQYTDRFNEIGEFQILAVLCDENLYFVDKNKIYYVMFDSVFFGKIENVAKDGDSEYTKTISLEGRSMAFILDKRIIYKQQNYTGSVMSIIKKIMDDNIRVSGPRFLNIVTTLPQNDKTREADERLQKTGGTVYELINSLMGSERIGFDLHPVISQLHIDEITGKQTNISQWEMLILTGRDRRRNNPENNDPVIFSHSFNNLRRASYEMNRSDECNVAYVAGEGEGVDRKWIEIDKDEKSGWFRGEIFVDARDVQSETESGTITDAQYNNALRTRGLQYLADNVIFENYEATIVEHDDRYVYGRDFYKGDYVTIQDNEIGIEINAQITEVTVSVEGNRETRDLVFGYKTINVLQRLKKGGAV